MQPCGEKVLYRNLLVLDPIDIAPLSQIPVTTMNQKLFKFLSRKPLKKLADDFSSASNNIIVDEMRHFNHVVLLQFIKIIHLQTGVLL